MEQDLPTLYLMKTKKTGILRLIFSRLGSIILLLLLQLFLFLSVYHWFTEYFPHFTVLQVLFSVIMVLYLFNCDMDSTSKLSWLFIIMLFPIPGTILLWFTWAEIGHRLEGGLVERRIRETRDTLIQEPEAIRHLLQTSPGTVQLRSYLNLSGCFPVYENTYVRYFPLGEEKFEAMLEELKRAEHFIFMEYFIIGEGKMWGQILAILAEKVKQGVEVRVMYDGMCEISTLSFDYAKRLGALGIQCKAFSPIKPFISTYYNYRDHRKILVIDGKTAFNGGVNLADEYINQKQRFGHWKDTAVMLKGDAVSSFTLMFLQMWHSAPDTSRWTLIRYIKNHGKDLGPEWTKYLNIPQNVRGTEPGFVMPFGDSPLDEYKVGENVYMDILYHAEKYVHIMTPYLILDGELETSLKYAAQRGIDVKLILPGIPDKKPAYALAKSHYRSLVMAGVKIYEYDPGFVHAKVFVSDDKKAVVGTINLDYRSLYHHFECATYMEQTRCIPDIERDFQETLAKCHQVTLETIKKEKLYYKLVGGVMKVFAPLM